MKAFLLAAGLGTRLRPLTDQMPKCLVRVGGRPLLDLWLDSFRAAGVDEVLVNLHHLPEQVRSHLAAQRGGLRRTDQLRTRPPRERGDPRRRTAISSGRTRCSSPSTVTTSPTST